jgi:iron complex transport system ATP-binding protein
MLSVNNISVVKTGKILLDDVSFSLDAGEVLAIIGPNGAGKTSLLNALSDPAFSKEIVFENKSLADFSVNERAKKIAVLPQISTLCFPFSVREVVALGRLPHSTGVDIDSTIVEEVLQCLDISHLVDRPYTQLSGGEKQRVQLARVMAQIWREQDAGQRLLILDEPSSSLDIGHQQQLMNIVAQFSEQGVGVIFVEHNLNAAIHVADSLLALSEGKCVAYGKPKEVVTPALMQTIYGVSTEIVVNKKTNKPVVIW